MCVPANYCMTSAKERADHGLLGGGVLSQMVVPSDRLAAGAFDESNAFTAVRIPEWLSFWQSTPPVLAMHLWNVLPAELRERFAYYFEKFPVEPETKND